MANSYHLEDLFGNTVVKAKLEVDAGLLDREPEPVRIFFHQRSTIMMGI